MLNENDIAHYGSFPVGGRTRGYLTVLENLFILDDCGHWNGRRNRLPHLAGSIVWRSRWGRKLISIAHPNPENGYAPRTRLVRRTVPRWRPMWSAPSRCGSRPAVNLRCPKFRLSCPGDCARRRPTAPAPVPCAASPASCSARSRGRGRSASPEITPRRRRSPS